MGPHLWKLVRDGEGGVATHAVFAAAVKQSALFGDFLKIAVGGAIPVTKNVLQALLDLCAWAVTWSLSSAPAIEADAKAPEST